MDVTGLGKVISQGWPLSGLAGVVERLDGLANAPMQAPKATLADSTQQRLAQSLLGKTVAILTRLERQLFDQASGQQPVDGIKQGVLVQFDHPLE